MATFLATLIAAAAALQAPAPLAPQSELPEPATARIHVVGASLSAGTGSSLELVTKRDVPLGRVLACALPAEGVTVVDHGDTWFFMDPTERGPKQITAALEAAPTLVIALDFLFWYGYGDRVRGDDARMARLELGLAELDRLACPIVIGDLPDISLALQGKGPLGQPIVSRSMFPSAEGLARLNQRIHEWMAARPRVHQVALGAMLTTMQKGEALVLRDNTWKPKDVSEALQADLLHPTARGSVWVALATVDVLARAPLGVPAERCAFAEKTVLERLMASTEAERAAELEKRAEREARRREREEKRKKTESERDKQPVTAGGV